MRFVRFACATLGVAAFAGSALADLSNSGDRPGPTTISVKNADVTPGTVPGDVVLGPLNTQADPSAVTVVVRKNGSTAETRRTVRAWSGERSNRPSRLLGGDRPTMQPAPPAPTGEPGSGKTVPGEKNDTSGLPDVDRSDPGVTSPIPAPGAAMLGSLGLALVGWLRRRAN